jgi:hypothetical protein
LIAAIQTPAIGINNQRVPLLIETSIATDTRRMKITLAIKSCGISALSPKGPWTMELKQNFCYRQFSST